MDNAGDRDIDSIINNFIQACHGFVEDRNLWQARLAAASSVMHCRIILQETTSNFTTDQKNTALLYGVFSAAFRDYIDCVELSEKNHLPHKEVEQLWMRIIDCIERINAVRPFIGGPISEWLITQSSQIYNEFVQIFGSGILFVSPVLVADHLLCNVCREDLRACSHHTGRIYDGKWCRGEPVGLTVKSFDLVPEPLDRRCRIWPWNFNPETGSFTTILLTIFNVADLTDPRDST